MSLLSLEPAILQRLTDLAPAGVRVLPAPDLAAIAEESQVAPAIRLVFGGYRVLEAQGYVTDVAVTWLACAVVRNVAEIRTGKPARAEAAELVSAIYQALAGWRPPGASHVMELTGAPKPFYHQGFYVLPLGFVCQQTLVADGPTETGPALTRATFADEYGNAEVTR